MRVVRLGPRSLPELPEARLMGVWAARPRSRGMSRGEQNALIVVLIVAALLLARESVKTGPAAPAPPAGKPGEIGKVVSPVPGGRFTSGFGRRQGSAVVSSTHNGADIAAPLGTPIRAIADGTVIVAGPAGGFGHWIQIRHRDDTVSVYGHMLSIPDDIRPGVKVRAGQRIADVGKDGQATGPHLHLEIWPGGDRSRVVDPKPWFAKHNARLT